MIKYLRIRYKFLLLAVLGVAAIILMSLLTQNILEEGLKKVKEVFENSQKVQNIQQDFIAPLFKLREETLSLIVVPDSEYKREIELNITPLIEHLNYSFSLLDGHINNIWKNYRDLIFVADGYKNYKKFVYISDGYMKEDYRKGAFMHTKYVERKQFYILISKLKELQTIQMENSYDTFMNAKKSFAKKQIIIISGVLVVIILTLLFGFLIARNIVFSLEIVQNGLKKFFDLLGRNIDKDKQIKIQLENRDEFGEMAKVINQNVEILREKLKKDISLIEDATSVFSDLKKGLLERRLKENASSSELNILKIVMNEMLDNLEYRIDHEIKERTKQGQLLIQQSKLASMGSMIGNIAHQWRQPLSEINAILLNMQVKKEYNDLDNDTFKESIEECDLILSHMSNTINDFQNFFKPSKEKTKFSLQEACRNASFIIESSLKYNNIKFNIDIKNDYQVFGYPREFSQAVLNILSNAKDALLERGIKDPYITLTLKKGKQYALVKIEDNAGGINEDVIERIFEPYYTTKHARQGTGIGLYMSKIIIEENMNGYIYAQNKNEGALFIIKLAINSH
ncbi:MAG: HAMP domain-containing sensor histidine kinase [Sulfurospirillaceae bacterium]|nr:HAMP domain-containing sensor histidine kinase [Sulfurospirillaceae bacterium]